MNRQRDALGIATGVVLFLAGAFALAMGARYGIWKDAEPGPGLLPALAGGGLCIFSVWAAITEGSAESEGKTHVPRLAGYVVGLVAFGLLMQTLGALLVIVLLFLWILGVVERLPWKQVAAITFCSTLGAWLLFDKLLGVPLPGGFLMTR